MQLLLIFAIVLIGFPIFIICLIVYAVRNRIAQEQLEEELRKKQESKIRQARNATLEAEAILSKLRQEEQARQLKLKQEEAAKQAELNLQMEKAIRLFHLNTFSVTTSNEKIAAIWNNKYPISLHDDPRMLENQVLALYQCVPILIDADQMSALFLDNNSIGTYHTDLTTCSCTENSVYNKPCKHIYRLFFELSHTPCINPGIVDKDGNVKNMIEDLSQFELVTFIDKALSISNSANSSIPYQKYISSGLLTLAPPSDEDYQRLLNRMTKDQIIFSLRTYGASGFYPSWSKFRLVTWVIENQRGYLQDQYSDYGIISINPTLKPWIDGVKLSKQSYRYNLPDKLPDDEFDPYDPYM